MMAGTAVLQTLATLCLLLLAAKMGSELARKVKLVPSIGELLAGALVLVATTGKILGCGLPVLLLTNDWRAALAIGSGMMARGGVSRSSRARASPRGSWLPGSSRPLCSS